MGLDDLYENPDWDLYGLLREVYLAVTTAIEDDTDEPELRDEMQDLMIRLVRTPGKALRPTDLIRATGMNPSSMTRLLDEAEALGLITREPDSADRRALLACLTPVGERRTGEWATRALDSTRRHLNNHLNATDASEFERILRQLRATTNAHQDEATKT